MRGPDGSIAAIPQSEAQQAANAGWIEASPQDIRRAMTHEAKRDPLEAVRQCYLRADDDYYSATSAFLQTSWASLTRRDPRDIQSLAEMYRLAEEQPDVAVAAEITPWVPIVVLASWFAARLAWRGFWAAVRAVIGEARRAWRG